MARNHDSASSNPARAAAVFRDLSDNSQTLDLLLRHETSFDR
ncbi:MAG TPA: hypothetical protein VEV85_19240 [Bryobacteraceae bacterium]|nr:hypothetical protein [Bryobacteraceae bacterium]